MKALCVSLVVGWLALGTGAVHARTDEGVAPEALKASRELTAILLSETVAQLNTRMSALLWPEVEQRLREKQPISAEQASSLRAELEQIQKDYLTDVAESMPTVYARHFTAAELRDLIAFYTSPIGQKALTVLPKVPDELMAALAPRLPRVQDEIIRSFKRILRKRGMTL